MGKNIRQQFVVGILIVCMGLLRLVWVSNAFPQDTPKPFTWEGELNPNNFDKWEVLSVQPSPQGIIWMFLRNPDKESPIDIVATGVFVDGTLMGYRYFKYGEPYSFTYDVEKDSYTEEEKLTCMECHQDQVLKHGEAI